MTHPLRLALVVVGLAAAVYGTASLTGGWLGTPPWWEREQTWQEFTQEHTEYLRRTGMNSSMYLVTPHPVATPDREWISGVVVAVGLGLVAFGVRPRRRRPASAP